MISIDGFEPRHRRGTIRGVGLFLIMTISSSLNYLASSGMAQTLTSLGTSPVSTFALSIEIVKIFFLKAGSPSIIELKNANSRSAG